MSLLQGVDLGGWKSRPGQLQALQVGVWDSEGRAAAEISPCAVDLTLAFPSLSAGSRAGQGLLTLPEALSSPRSTVPVVHPEPLLLPGDTSCSAQPDLINLLNLFSLRPCVNHFSHCFLPNSLWPDLLLLLLMYLERGAKGPSWTWSRAHTLCQDGS